MLQNEYQGNGSHSCYPGKHGVTQGWPSANGSNVIALGPALQGALHQQDERLACSWNLWAARQWGSRPALPWALPSVPAQPKMGRLEAGPALAVAGPKVGPLLWGSPTLPTHVGPHGTWK